MRGVMAATQTNLNINVSHSDHNYLQTINFPKTGLDLQNALQDPNSPFYKLVEQDLVNHVMQQIVIEKLIDEILFRSYQLSLAEKERLLQEEQYHYEAEKKYFAAEMARLAIESQPNAMVQAGPVNGLDIEKAEFTIAQLFEDIAFIDRSLDQVSKDFKAIEASENQKLREIILDPNLTITDQHGEALSQEDKEVFLNLRENIRAQRDPIRTQQYIAESHHRHALTQRENEPAQPKADFVKKMDDVMTMIKVLAALRGKDEQEIISPQTILAFSRKYNQLMKNIDANLNIEDKIKLFEKALPLCASRAEKTIEAEIASMHLLKMRPEPKNVKKAEDDEELSRRLR